MIDLRSDTVTVPDGAMRAAMASAAVGDDVYGEDPTVRELEDRVATLAGHEAGLFCVSGSLANLLGVGLLVEPGTEVLCDAAAHIARAEMGAHAAVHGVTMRTWTSVRGVATTGDIEALLAPDAGPYLVSTAAVSLENTHNFGGGTVQPLGHVQEVAALCRDAGVGLHLDGARLWNAHIATGIAIADYARLFDTVSLALSKGLGAPVGTVLVSSARRIAQARVMRKRLGGGWRQAGILAAAGLHALDHNIARLADDHAAAWAFADEVARRAPHAVDLDPALGAVQTNIVVLDTGQRPAADVAAAAASRGVAVSALGRHMVRAVTHLGVSLDQAHDAGVVLGGLLRRS